MKKQITTRQLGNGIQNQSAGVYMHRIYASDVGKMENTMKAQGGEIQLYHFYIVLMTRKTFRESK